MLSNYGLLLAQWEERDPDRLRKLLVRTWDRLDEGLRRRFLHLMMGMIYRVARSRVMKLGVPTGEPVVMPFSFGSDEIDMDRTVEANLGRGRSNLRDIFVFERKRRKSAVVIVMDASGSMQGEKLAMAACTCASLAVNLDARDDYAVVLFSERVKVCKGLDQAVGLDEILRTVLEVRPEGRTDIGVGLEAGLREIRRSGLEKRMGILLTDGQQNVGQDPLAVARRYPQLHVILLPGGNRRLAEEIAAKGRGGLIGLKTILDVPRAVLQCLQGGA
ncbi:MAG TPA: vWA domain-containing protein [Syntrophales bacterium]|nr:vWA domain-containing protein [Syntrophales bacterium]HOM07714.1 vWA domain-containing protein [Syntrophales bacterium]HOO00796.1 vWA domain-containing protein [Syntrophales bacterium]HPC00820.1 vWA domain-containing protein [Syntrophales bacterium]HPQ07238.1 vWA domain-containing protein [Syntrophales bacterium]